MYTAVKQAEMRVPLKVWGRDLMDERTIQQMANICQLPFVYKHAALMPDGHVGIGATIGSVVATSGAVIPSAVGVDIGCGMVAVRTNISANHLPDNLHEIRSRIEAAVPAGEGKFIEGLNNSVKKVWGAKFETPYLDILSKYPEITPRRGYPWNQIGTLGGGNHFIEICLDTENQVWVMLHSGSRGIGNRIGTFFISKAKEEMRRLFINLPDTNLAYLAEGSDLFDDYVSAVSWAQDYAMENRQEMLRQVLGVLRAEFPDFKTTETAINCHHNYIARENHFGQNVLVTRKGAVRAREGDLGIIPGNMGDRSFIVRGKGNAESFHSCSHGAGRAMSRTEAKKRFTLEDHALATEGVECRKDLGVLDETPAAYKSIDAVMEAQSDLVDVLYTLKQVCCVKG